MSFLIKFRPAWLLIALVGVACVSTTDAVAGTARNFLGSYALQNVVTSGDQVSATFVMNAQNNSDADISNGVFELEDITQGNITQPGEIYLTSAPLSIPKHGSVVFQGNIAIPSHEYALWRQGGMPRVLMRYTDVAGVIQSQVVEVSSQYDTADQVSNDMVNAMLQSSLPPDDGQ